MKYLFVVLVFITTSSFAAAKTILVLEKRSQLGVEQTGVVLENNLIKVVSNTNLFSSEYPLHMGVMELPVGDLAKEFAKVSQPEKVKDPMFLSHHDLTVYVNGDKVPVNSRQFSQVIALIKKVMTSKKLKLKDGVIVKDKKEAKSLKCSSKENNICTFKYGYIHGVE